MRIVFVIAVLITATFNAYAQESADFSSTAGSTKEWGKSPDVFVQKSVERAKVKALVDELLREDRSKPTTKPEETSAETQTAD